ncbi:MAG: phosphorylase [Chitinophagaceae bacterium]|nr:MAG: phosphorylase [Chitinophagaceae bacterium]
MIRVIPEAELIINPDGRIYHLNLHPDDVADTIITVGDPDRVKMITNYFDKIEIKAANREFVTHTGTLNGKRLTVISTGIGTDNIDIVLNELDALVNIDFNTRTEKKIKKSLNIIRIGTSGGLQKNIPLDSFVISTGGLGLDGLLHFYKYLKSDTEEKTEKHLSEYLNQYNQIFRPYFREASAKLISAFPEDQFVRGVTATCTGFYGPQQRSLRAKPAAEDFLEVLTKWKFEKSQITNFEMETAGIIGVSNLLGHHSTSLNGIIAQRHDGKFSSNPGKTVKRLIESALPIILKI